MKNEELVDLHEKTMRVLNIKGYLEDYNESIGISKEELVKSLFLAEMNLENILVKLSPSVEVHDSIVFTSDGENNPINIGTQKMSEEYLSVPYYEDGRSVNVRVSIMEI